MRFTAMYIADISRLGEQSVDELYDSMEGKERAGKGIVDEWIDEHFNKTVRCMVCGTRGRVNPNDDNDMVITISSEGGVIIACDECLGMFCYTAILGMRDKQSGEVVGRITTDLVKRTITGAEEKLANSMGGLIALQQAANLYQRTTREDDSPEAKMKWFAEKLNYQA